MGLRHLSELCLCGYYGNKVAALAGALQNMIDIVQQKR